MELDGLARCLAHLRAGNGSPSDLTWKKIERLIRLCPNCQFKSINKIPSIRQLRAALDRQKERKPPFDRLYPPQDQLLDIKPDTIYHFDELEQQSVLALCKYLCVSHGQYLHKILPLLIRYLATLHLAKWPPHYFKNLFLMKYQHNQNTEQSELEQKKNEANTNDIGQEQEPEPPPNTDIKTETDNNLIAIIEEPEKLDKSRNSMMDEEVITHPAPPLTTEISAADRSRESDDEHKGNEADDEEEIEVKYDEDIGDEHENKAAPNNLNDADNDLMKYMDNPLRSPLCQFVMEFVYNIGDISHAVEESAPIIRQAIIIILKEYIKILKEDDDGLQNNLGDEYELDNKQTHQQRHHSFYIVLPIIWGILNAIKEDVYVSINIDRKCALSVSKCVDTLSKYNKNNAFSGYWKSEWDILSTGVRASLLAYFVPPHGPCKAPKKVFETRIIKDYFNASMAIIGVKKSPASIVLREQHMRLATICAIYEPRLRSKLEKTIKDILHFHINKYIKSSFNVYHNKQKQKQYTLKYRMRDQTILINACCLVLEQLAERAPDQLQEISYYLQKLLIDRNAIYLQDEEINERLMDALARVCQCELKYMEQHPIHNKRYVMDVDDDGDEEKQLLVEEEEEKRTHHKGASSGIMIIHRYDDSSTRGVFNELENNFDDSVNEDSKLINRALRIYGAMMVKVNHKLITQQFLTSSIKGTLTQKLTVILPYLIDTAINQQATEVQFVKEIVQLLVQSYLTKSSSYQLDTKRKIAEAFTQLSSNLTQYNLRQFILCELLKMFTTLSKTILNNHIKKKGTLPLASNELGLILPAIAVLCTPLYHDVVEDDVVEDDVVAVDDDDDNDNDNEHQKHHKKIFKINIKKRDKKHRRHKSDNKTEDVSDNNNNNDNDNVNPSYFGTNQYIAESWGVTLMDNHSQTVAIFREFWNQIIFFDFVASTNNEYKIYLQTIASVSPVLVCGSSTLVGGGLIHEVLKNKTNSLNINKQIMALRSKLSLFIKLDINHLEPDALLFLNVVYSVESFRVYSGRAYALAHYLNDAGIIRMNLQNYIEAIVDYVFDRYLEHIYSRKASSDKLISLENHVEYLLAMCCSRSSRIRSKCYNWLQHKLIAAYSYLQWRPSCLQNILDIVSKLETLIDDVSTELYCSNDTHSVITFNDKFSLDLPEDRKSRSQIRSIILDIAGAWLHNAWNLAPSEMISVVAHKLSTYKSPLLSSLMYTQCRYNENNAQPNMGLMYVVSKCERYLGVMEGLYRTHLLHHIQKSFGQSKANLFIQTFKRYIAMTSTLSTLHQGMIEEMYQVAALIVWCYNKNVNISLNNKHLHHFKLPLEELLHLICMVPAIIFESNIVLCGTFVWRWIMTTSPQLQEALIRQMRPSWSFVIEQRKGIFANKYVNNRKEIEAHDIWISWLLNCMENIIESSPESVENISVIMIDGLAAIPYDTDVVRNNDTYIATFGARLRFYTAVARILNALRLASVPLLSKTIATILRGRLYQGVLQLFESKIVWRYPSSWKNVSSNAKAIVELFQFFITEHRQIITSNNDVPKPPSINIDNHRSKSSPIRITSAPTMPRPSLTTTMPYLNTTTTMPSDLSSHSVASLHQLKHLKRRHKKAKSLYYNDHQQRSVLRPRPFTAKSHTHRSPSIRRNSFGHAHSHIKHNTSFDLDLNRIDIEEKDNNDNKSYLFKFSCDDVYYWEGNNAFIQDKMTNWLHLNGGWSQMVCCVLLADELERLCAWYNNIKDDDIDDNNNNIDDVIDDDIEDRISSFVYQEVLIGYISKIVDSEWNILIDTSWSFNPLLAVRFYQRFKYIDLICNTQITSTLTDHIHRSPSSIVDIPDAVHLLITASTVKKDGIELEELCQFSCAPLYKCLALLSEKNLTHSIVNQYLFRSLRNESQLNMNGVIFLIPQLLHALRFDPSGILREFLIDCAANDLTMAHQLIWLCDCESYQGEDMHSLQPLINEDDEEEDFCKAMERLSADIRQTFTKNNIIQFYQNEFEFFDLINSASVDIEASKYNKKQKKGLIRASLIEIRDSISKYNNNNNLLYMPTNPTWQIVDVLPDSVIALQSAAKVPFLVDFKVRKYADDIAHMLQNNEWPLIKPNIEIQKCIFKTHDDCGQDALALQIIEYFKLIFTQSGLPLLLFPYRVIATRSGKDKVVGGMIECVKNARSRSDLGAENNYRLRRYFIETYGDIESASFRKAQRNFILSLAGYAVVCYLLQIKDRHNANIMINNEGHLIHIDFGFLFDISPGKNIGFETAGFKINDEMVELIGDDGSHTTPLFEWFVELCIRGYLVCREHMEQIISIIQLSSNSNLPCFLPQTMTNLRNRFVPEKSQTQAAKHMKERVIHACDTWTTNAYDEFQKRSQGIWKAPAKDED